MENENLWSRDPDNISLQRSIEKGTHLKNVNFLSFIK